MKNRPIVVPAAVWEGLEVVRLSGGTNMLDRPRVIEIAEMIGYDETVEWLRNHKYQYAEGIFAGFVVDEEGGSQCAD